MEKNKTMSRGKWLKLVRRCHLYSGLAMFPWVLLFGISGLLFNHPNVGEKVSGERLSQELLSEHSGLKPWQPEAAAIAVIAALNRESPRSGYALEAAVASEFTGVTILQADSTKGRRMLILEMGRGMGILTEKQARSGQAAPFATTLSIPEYSSARLEKRAAGLLQELDKPALTQLKAHPRIAQELRFVMSDADGTLWNATYNTGSGRVEGRRTDQWSDIGIAQLLAKLHTAHHFTIGFGFRWLWALIEDLLGLTLVFWALSGLVMWWQMKPTRLAGVVSIVAAVGVAGALIWGTSEELMFGHVAQQLGP